MKAVLLALLAAASEDLLGRFREIEAERSRALKAADLPAIERLYADDFVGISATGEVIRKRELVDNIRRRGASVNVDDDHFAVGGDEYWHGSLHRE